jgi:hypothetical protein
MRCWLTCFNASTAAQRRKTPMQPEKSKWEGRRAIIVVRQSNDKDGTSSTQAQLDYMQKELARVGMQYVDKNPMEGVSGAADRGVPETVPAEVGKGRF